MTMRRKDYCRLYEIGEELTEKDRPPTESDLRQLAHEIMDMAESVCGQLGPYRPESKL
jgi:hypothetical protein